MRLILLGPAGVGKGTQAARLADRALIAHVASGDLFRENVGRGTELGRIAKGYMDRGELVPDDVTIRMVLDRARRDDATKGYILDGFPRNLAQAEALDGALKDQGDCIDWVLLLDCKQQELVRRLTGRAEEEGRTDDTPEAIRVRFTIFEEQTRPVVDYYEGQGKLKRVNGDRTIETVTEELCTVVGL